MASDESESQPRPNFEQALAELETIMHELEEGKLGLAEGLARYEQGVGLLKQCHELLSQAERRIELLCGVDADGNPITQPFEPGPEQTLEDKARTRGKRRSAPRPTEERGSDEAESAGDIDEPRGLF
ncbi:MAG TPA: exodeoxyribonuclease VII small subunit [Pirellulales bacterium]|nr:exodeoxyribonuclease VII small subunit [Pirellulales bacterium]